MTAKAPVFGGVLEAIGNTPLIEVTHMDTGPCRLFLKLESQNPGGSIKDRIGKSMIEAAEKDGSLKPGGKLIEATAGNTGLGLALVAAQKGYHLTLIVPDKMAQEKIFHLKALGTEVILTRSDVGKGHPEYYQDMAERIAAETGAIFVNQFDNPANPYAHETTTGPEILEQMDGDLDAMVCGVGSGGTITGLGRYFAKASPKTEMVLADPEGSILAEYVNTGHLSEDVGSWVVEGIGEDFIPAGLGPLPGQDSLHRQRPGSPPDGARAADQGRHPRRFLVGHPDRRRPALLPGAERAQAGRDLRLRQRQQVPLQDVQRLLDGGSGLHQARAAQRSARPDRPAA